MRVRPLSPASWLILALSLGACTGDDDKEEDTSGPVCDAPIAVAGADITGALGSVIKLDATGSSWCEEYDAEDMTFTWAFEQVPAESAVNETGLSDNDSSTASSPSFAPDEDGYYVLSLVVTDPAASSDPSLVVVTIYVEDAPPVADCGDDVSGEIDQASTLDGSASYDPEGAELEYSWSISQAPACSEMDSDDIHNSATPSASIVPDCDGVYVMGLVVNDGAQWSEYDYCTVDVATENRTPVADAGDTDDLGACADDPMQLNGHGSYDLDGDDLEYQWSVVEVPSDSAADDSSFSDATEPDPYFDWDTRGSYTFQLQVYDGEYWSAPDIVTLTINETNENTSPVANAGEDVEISTEADCTSSSYDWTCDDCAEVDFDLDGSSSTDADGDVPDYYWSESTGAVAFTNAYSALTDGTVLEQPAEYGVELSLELEVVLTVSDCLDSDDDSLMVYYTCTGEAAE